MGKLATIGKVTIRVFGNDHLPPHFHVKGTDFEALVAIAGDLPTATRKEVLAWATANRDALVAEWNTWNPTIPFA
ncbi:DUF4160 domain-containing protein [Azospirillum formosense]|uniref:DUF4160 domain-containing protein n=1 Tax=Azospirillum formosense TaxID=861533 RepID=A0ABX2KV34_9PROT|nr:DUF4160 domain-containing protein [Azospirillum formosense]MBY3755718.1 DUF4160 domain-containing protein [Azospirillum formosense]NUB18407.1 DUF4160 domain-containing protein [Azospirillum formosense]